MSTVLIFYWFQNIGVILVLTVTGASETDFQ